MPFWKYISNRVLTFLENVLLGAKLSEYHTGYRAFSREILTRLDLAANSDDFVFDNQMLAQILWHGFTIAEISCPTRYFPEASSINLRRSIAYGLGCLSTALEYRLAKMGLLRSKLFEAREGSRLSQRQTRSLRVDGLLGFRQAQRQSGLLAVRGGFVNHARLGSFIESGSDIAQGLAGVFAFAGAEKCQIAFFQRVQA